MCQKRSGEIEYPSAPDLYKLGDRRGLRRPLREGQPEWRLEGCTKHRKGRLYETEKGKWGGLPRRSDVRSEFSRSTAPRLRQCRRALATMLVLMVVSSPRLGGIGWYEALTWCFFGYLPDFSSLGIFHLAPPLAYSNFPACPSGEIMRPREIPSFLLWGRIFSTTHYIQSKPEQGPRTNALFLRHLGDVCFLLLVVPLLFPVPQYGKSRCKL